MLITKLEYERRKKKMTQRQLGKIAGVNNSLISRYESGNYQMLNPKLKRAIAKTLHAPVKELFTKKDIT